MADSRRSSRARKEVDYSTYSGGGDSDDGDFTGPTPPPAKKLKEEKERTKKKTKKKRSSSDMDDDYDEFKETPRGKRKDRKPVEDRMFDRELELALEMSKHESSQETNDEMNSAPKRRAKEVNAVVHSAPLQPAEADSDELPAPDFLYGEPESMTSPPVQGSPVKRSPLKESPVKESPAREPKVQKSPFKESPVKKSPARKPKVQRSPVKESPVKKSPARKPKVQKSPVKKTPAPAKRTPTTTSAPAKQTPSIGRGGSLKRSAPPSKPLVSSTPKSKCNVALTSPRTVALKRPAASPSAASGNNPLGGVKLASSGVPIRLGLSKFARIKPLHGKV